MSDPLAAAIIGALVGLFVGWGVGVAYPPCSPGAQRSCDPSGGGAGIQYCTEHGLGWETCQVFPASGPYPQALWRGR